MNLGLSLMGLWAWLGAGCWAQPQRAPLANAILGEACGNWSPVPSSLFQAGVGVGVIELVPGVVGDVELGDDEVGGGGGGGPGLALADANGGGARVSPLGRLRRRGRHLVRPLLQEMSSRSNLGVGAQVPL